MGYGYGCHDYPSENPKKWMTREKWLNIHPEDKYIDDENIAARTKGYDDQDIRQLMAAICLRAVVDYKNAYNKPDMVDVVDSCHDFFGSEMFQFFVNGMDVAKVEKAIEDAPKSMIHNIWRQPVDSQILQGL